MTADNSDAHARMQALLAEGLPVREVARQTGWSYGYVHKHAMLMGKKMTRGHPSPQDHPWRNSRVGRKPKKEGDNHAASGGHSAEST